MAIAATLARLPMTLSKRIEVVAKLVLALVAAALLWRPGRGARAKRLTATARRLLVVRIDDRVGEALLTTALLEALARRLPDARVDVLVHPKAARVLKGHPRISELIAFDRRWLFLGPLAPGVRAIRAFRYEAVINCGNWEVPSVTSAIVSRLVAPRAALVGPAVWPTGLLADLPVPARADTVSEVAQRLHLLSALGVDAAQAPLSFRAPKVGGAFLRFIEGVRAAPHAVLNPGGRLGWRRLPAAAFAAAARALLEAGRRPVVTWGPGEEELANEIAALAPGSVVAPRSDLDELAALMAAAGLTVCNNTGPMHLSVAVGAPTLGLFLKMSPERWGHRAEPHRMVDLTPCPPEELEAKVRAEVLSFAAYVSGRASSTSITGMSSLMS